MGHFHAISEPSGEKKTQMAAGNSLPDFECHKAYTLILPLSLITPN